MYARDERTEPGGLLVCPVGLLQDNGSFAQAGFYRFKFVVAIASILQHSRLRCVAHWMVVRPCGRSESRAACWLSWLGAPGGFAGFAEGVGSVGGHVTERLVVGHHCASQPRGACAWGGYCVGVGTTGCCSQCSWLTTAVMCVMCGRLAITGWRPARVLWAVVGMPCWRSQDDEVKRCTLPGLLWEACAGGHRVVRAPVQRTTSSRCPSGVSVVVASVSRSASLFQASLCSG